MIDDKNKMGESQIERNRQKSHLVLENGKILNVC